MKRFLLIAVSLFSISMAQAQKIKVKKDKVLIDDVPILSVTEKTGIFRFPNYLYSSLNGDSLLRFKQILLRIPTIMLKEELRWYEVSFIPFGLKVQFIDTAGIHILTRKEISRFLFSRIKINQGKLDSASVVAFCKRVDATEKLQAQIDFKKTLYEAQVKSLSVKLSRNLRRPVILRLIVKNGVQDQVSYESLTKSEKEFIEYGLPTDDFNKPKPMLVTPMGNEYGYEIIQDDKLLGIIYESVMQEGKKYRIEKRVNPDFVYQNQRFPFLPIAYLGFLIPDTRIKMYDNKTDSLYELSSRDFKLTIVDYLILHNYL